MTFVAIVLAAVTWLLQAAMLDQWQIRPDDSAGEPLTLAPTGRFLRMVADLFGQPVTGEGLLALLKHPATGRGGDRGAHLRHTLKLERHVREKGVAFPDAAFLLVWGLGHAGDEVGAWAGWLAGLLEGLAHIGQQELSVFAEQHFALVEALARGNKMQMGRKMRHRPVRGCEGPSGGR